MNIDVLMERTCNLNIMSEIREKRLNKNITTSYTFENFIVNDNNAALAVCDNYENTYNHLFMETTEQEIHI